MNFSHGYGPAIDDQTAAQVIHRAFDLGVNFFDTAALYGAGLNELMVGKAIQQFRSEIVLCTKGGMSAETDPSKPKRRIDSRPEVIRQNCEESLRRLNIEVIDLYYLHRWDKITPLEDVIGAMARLVESGKVRAIGLSEVSAHTLRKAHAVFPITAVQSEYSLWTRNPEIAVIQACRETGCRLVAFSPLGRGFLSGVVRHPQDIEKFPEGDMRRTMPRFQGDNLRHNLSLINQFEVLARKADCTMSQLAIAWVLRQDPTIIPIPGSRSLAHTEENIFSASLHIDESILQEAGKLISEKTVLGNRYDANASKAVDTEDFNERRH
jgi:aryl-alcohol dehydrogenase-like predicted oxidoreductase